MSRQWIIRPLTLSALLLLASSCQVPTSQPDALTVSQSCGAIGDLEKVAAAEMRAGRLTDAQKARVFVAQDAARPLCLNPAATAADPTSVNQLRALVPAISAALARE